MPLPVTTQYPPPQSWEEFESMCADLFARMWNTETQKHGRQGQPQGGVDVYGCPDGKNWFGVQCKKKETWPPSELTLGEIDEEVEKAKSWKPGLKHFVIASTGPNDQKAQAHVRTTTKAHKKEKLFSVEVMSWPELTRRLAGHSDLLVKYGYREDVAETVKLTIETLRAEERVTGSAGGLVPVNQQSLGTTEALERDLLARFTRALRRTFFPEAMERDEYIAVADIAREAQYSSVSPDLRRRIFLRASRSAAVRGSLERAEELLQLAQNLDGSGSDLLARARILERRGDIDGSLRLLRDEDDSDSRSTVLNILFRHRGAETALKWLADEGLSVPGLTSSGIQTLSVAYLQQDDFEGLRLRLDEITSAQLSDGPYFYFLRAIVNTACVLPAPDRGLALRSFQMDARRGVRSILLPAVTAERLDRAIDDLTALLPLTAELELREARRLAEAYIRWCELLHPYRKQAGLARLRNDIMDPRAARERLSLAFAFDPDFKPDTLEQYLKRREQLGGLDDEDLKALLIIRIHGDDPASVASLISRYRSRFEADYKDPPIFTIEIQALAWAGDTSSARLLLDKHRNQLTPEGVAGFEALIAKGKGEDPVVEDLKLYESTNSLESLRALVASLAGRADHRAIAKYSEELHGRTSDPLDIARAARAYGRLGDGVNFIRLMEAHPFLSEQDAELLRHYGWELFKRGRLKNAKEQADRLARTFPESRDLQLEIAIAIESGEWESLAKPLTAFLDDASRYSGLELVRAASLAQQSGHGPTIDLVRAAIAKADNDPHVWLGAYSIVIEEGLEDDMPESQEWFRRALALSGKDGPVQQFELKELIPQQEEWNRRTRDISERVNRAEVPLTIAAPGLRTTLVDILLRNLITNAGLSDARRKYVIPLFSGHRSPQQVGEAIQSLGLDISALMVLGWLGLLPRVLKAFRQVTLPASVMAELFEGIRRIQQVQKSRIKRARELEQAILHNRVKIVRTLERLSDPLSSEVGAPLAALIEAATEVGGTVLRPAPIHRPALDQIAADVSAILPRLCDMHTLLRVLVDNGAVSQADEEAARKYLEMQDTGLTGCAVPDIGKPLFIDDLALVYLQYTNLLEPVLKLFKDVRIEGSAEDEVHAIIEHHKHVQHILDVVHDIRNTIRSAAASGNILFGPRNANGGGRQQDDEGPSILHLLSDLRGVDAIVCDDRAINKENYAADNRGTRIPCLTTLDIMEELLSRQELSQAEWQSARHKLRIGGAALVPVHVSEVVHAARRSRTARSAEIRALEQSIDLARFAEVPNFPREINWFAVVSMAMKSAIIEMWKAETDFAVASRLSNMIMSAIPKPGDWASRWDHGPPPDWADAVDRLILASLAMPVELENAKAVQAYNQWVEQYHLEPLRSVWPEKYRAVVEYVRSLALNIGDDDEKEAQEIKQSGRAKKGRRDGQARRKKKSSEKVSARNRRPKKTSRKGRS